MKSESEEFCKAGFDTYLRKIIPTSNLLWKEVEQKAEPPDFYLSVNTTKYAVEVTILIEKVDVGAKNHLPVSIIRDLLENFVNDEVEAIARDSGYLRGAYLVVFSKPITNFANTKYMIQAKLLSFISETQAESKVPPRVIYKDGRQECLIEKLHNQQDKVVMGGPVISKWAGEALTAAKQLLDDRLDEKKHRLRNISDSKILLLHDKYPFASRETYKTYILEVPPLHSFHTVFVVGSNKEGEILYSQEPTWVQSS
ncbi:hypothetical protein MUO98_03475 [Candidatus Bathyarchaeota archaeon]|nr:hypothetical protein [Candidatus Bathyarchaeota archaeon]